MIWIFSNEIKTSNNNKNYNDQVFLCSFYFFLFVLLTLEYESRFHWRENPNNVMFEFQCIFLRMFRSEHGRANNHRRVNDTKNERISFRSPFKGRKKYIT